jgi:hypothetical protein
MWKLGLWPRNFFSGNICFEFSLLVLCSVCIGTNSCYLHSFDLITLPRQENMRRLRYLHDGPAPMLELYFILVSVSQLFLVALLYSSALTMKTREIKKIYYIKDVKYFYQVTLRKLKLNTASFINEVSCLPHNTGHNLFIV